MPAIPAVAITLTNTDSASRRAGDDGRNPGCTTLLWSSSVVTIGPRSVFCSDGKVMIDVSLLDRGELLVVSEFNVHQVVVGLRERSNQLIELQLRGGLFAALRVLNREDHHRRHGCTKRCERRFPRGGETRDREGYAEGNDHADNNHGRSRP